MPGTTCISSVIGICLGWFSYVLTVLIMRSVRRTTEHRISGLKAAAQMGSATRCQNTTYRWTWSNGQSCGAFAVTSYGGVVPAKDNPTRPQYTHLPASGRAGSPPTMKGREVRAAITWEK